MALDGSMVVRGGAIHPGRAAILVGMQRRQDIEGLRAVAVLAVLLFHAGVPRVAGGYVGVDVFFVVSGFLITSLMVAEKTSTGSISLGAFYARRARRILPASALVAVSTLVASYVWLEPLRIQSLIRDVWGVATFSSNLVFAHRGADYLQSTLPPSPLQHYWSLAVEEQFYLVWPALIALVCWGAASQSRVSVRARIGLVSAVAAVASFVACMITMDRSQPWAFFAPHTRAFELAIGAFVAVLPIAASRVARWTAAAIAWCGLGVIVASVTLFDERTRFPGPWALVPVLATAVLLRGGDSTAWSPKVLLSLAPLQWLGSRSYSAYLWHWPVLIIAAAALGKSLTVFEGLVCLMMSVSLAELTYRWVENPIRRNIAIRGLRAAAMATSLVAVVAGSAVLANNNPPRTTTGSVATTPTLVVGSTTTLPPGSTVPGSQSGATPPTLPPPSTAIEPIIAALSATGLPSNITPSLRSALNDEPILYKNGCHANFSSTKPKTCAFGKKSSPIVIGLYGDSHAAQWFPAFQHVADKLGWKLMTYTKRGCPPADIPTYSKVLGKVYTECGPWRRNVLAKMSTDGVKVVFVAHFDRSLSATTRLPMWTKEWREGLQGTIDALTGKGIVPVLLEDTPYPGQDIPTCLSRHYTNVQLCTSSFSNAYRSDMMQLMGDFADAGTHVLWVHDWFCAPNGCPTVVGNVMVYRDDNHMTGAYSKYVAPLLESAIAPLVDWYSRPR